MRSSVLTTLKQARFSSLRLHLDSKDTFSTKDGVDGFGGIDILVMRISILFIIIVKPRSIVNGLWSIIISKLLGIDVLEEAAILHGVIGLGMILVGTLQSFVVILLIVTTTSRFLDHVDLMVVFVGTLAYVIIMIIGPPIMIIMAVVIVVFVPITTLAVVVPTMVIGLLIPTQWVLRA
jgi:hypothetical protein